MDGSDTTSEGEAATLAKQVFDLAAVAFRAAPTDAHFDSLYAAKPSALPFAGVTEVAYEVARAERFNVPAVGYLAKALAMEHRLQEAHLGFPNGAGTGVLSAAFLAALGDHSTIGAWGKQIENRLARMNTFRNDTVHSGFRRQDIAPETLREFDEITTLACTPKPSRLDRDRPNVRGCRRVAADVLYEAACPS